MFENNRATRFSQTTSVDQATYDAGLRSYMLGVYNYMTIGLALTGVVALAFYMLSVTDDPTLAVGRIGSVFLTEFGRVVFTTSLSYVIMFAPLAIIFFMSFGFERLSVDKVRLVFLTYAALIGMSMASIFFVFSHDSIVRVFFITAASFASLSLWGYTTKKDLTGVGSFLIMGVFGILIASVVNMFMQSSFMHWAISVVSVFVFAGLTAYDTQKIKSLYYQISGSDAALREKVSIYGALKLYIDFIVLFQSLLSLLGNRRG